ncbi:site-2 protease family protein [Cognatazoarcus halotolerans]|uniref:site-2 protease family protein n=1 Tax=Cognatazoarcus halotolerans TaxID=2686016 RepID=UPI00135C2A89|nr:site-2 protease family protein [Cognatazoarcus halotolerans]MCB1898875.1 site-2 protease family protein [Rhodocyclaceae bacterium]MCP5309094.1 site-2 protease family protein [Zoogloeaceae bacterium]
MEQLISTLAIWAIPVLFAITLHEAAHGYVARHFGDPTAERAGRITLNPLSHIDPVGTLLVPGLILAVSSLFGGGMLFGWAKPVPVSFGRLRRPKADMLWVAAAGPFANLLMAIGWALMFGIALRMGDSAYRIPMMKMADAGVQINAILMFLNLIPVPPLDGGRIAVSLLPNRLAANFAKLEPYGFPILLLLLVTGMLEAVLGPLVALFRYSLDLVFGL